MSEQQNNLQDDRERKGKILDNLFTEAIAVNVPKIKSLLCSRLFFCCSYARLTLVIVLQNQNEVSQTTRGVPKNKSRTRLF